MGDGRIVVGAFGAIDVWDTSTGDIEPFFGPADDLSGYPFPEDVAVIDGTICAVHAADPRRCRRRRPSPTPGHSTAMDDTVEVGVTAELQNIGRAA
ncbi:MAG: hypothetical protein WKF45_05085 [Ilumatobacteraceae bacterium]